MKEGVKEKNKKCKNTVSRTCMHREISLRAELSKETDEHTRHKREQNISHSMIFYVGQWQTPKAEEREERRWTGEINEWMEGR